MSPLGGRVKLVVSIELGGLIMDGLKEACNEWAYVGYDGKIRKGWALVFFWNCTGKRMCGRDGNWVMGYGRKFENESRLFLELVKGWVRREHTGGRKYYHWLITHDNRRSPGEWVFWFCTRVF